MHDALRDVADRVFGGLADALGPGAHLIVERTPWHAYHLDLIGAVYPDAAVVHIVRDGRDVARSLLSQPWGPTTMADAAEEWRSAVDAARADAPGLARYREVRYEELLADPGDRLPELYRWLGLDDRDEVVRPALIEAGVRFNTDERRPEVGHGKWRSELSALDQRTFDRVAGSMLESLSYERVPPPALAGDLLASARSVARAGARSIARAARRRAGDEPGAGGVSLDQPTQHPRRSVARMEQIQQLLDLILAAFNDGNATALGELLARDAFVREVRDGSSEEGRDGASHDAFLDAVSDAAVGRGPQRIGDVHVGDPLAAMVVGYDDGAGELELHTLVVTLKGDLIDRVTWYRPGELPPS
jgi:hypothetical protein